MHTKQTRFARKSALAAALGLAVSAAPAVAYLKADESPGHRKVVVAKLEHRRVADFPKAAVPDRDDVSVERPIRRKLVPKMPHAEVPSKKPAPDREP